MLDLACARTVLSARAGWSSGIWVIEAGDLGPRLEVTAVPPLGAITLTSTARGFAWASTADSFGTIDLATYIDARVEHHPVPGFPRDFAPPGLAPWPFEADTLALVPHTFDGLALLVIGEDGGVLARTDRIAPSMFGETTPAVVGTPQGLLVAQVEFGDLDPSSGRVSIRVFDRDLAPIGAVLSFDAGRSPALLPPRIAAAWNGELAVIHWTDYDNLPRVGVPRTRAIVLRCE